MRKAEAKKLTIKIVITAICMVAIVSLMLVGISAGRVERFRVNTIVNIPAREVEVDISANVSGHINTNGDIQSTYNAIVSREMTEIPAWEIGNLEFDRNGDKDITISILVKNSAERPLKLAFLIPPDHNRVGMKYSSGVNIVAEDIVLNEKVYDSTLDTGEIESTSDFRVLESVEIETNEFYKIQITMSVINKDVNFEKPIERNFGLTMTTDF